MSLHVLPNNDLRGHVEDSPICPCLPRVLEDGELIVHNAYDGRETGEVCRKALDMLGRALTDHNHEWTVDERDARDHAILILNMHWPAKPAEDTK